VLITGGAEILFPLPFIKDQRSLRTSLFWDVGNVFNTNCGSQKTTTTGEKVECNGPELSGLASSVGVGVTWITALGPLSFALAMPVKKPDDSTETQVFQFSLGQTF
jgi:outer membrane protein insertion porin family